MRAGWVLKLKLKLLEGKVSNMIAVIAILILSYCVSRLRRTRGSARAAPRGALGGLQFLALNLLH